MKYIAIKLKGYSYWIWFEVSKTDTENNIFRGSKGWGKDGALTEIEVSENEIIGKIFSENLQY